MTTRLNQLLELLSNQPDEPFILFALAKEFEQIQDLEQAASYYLKVLENDPDYLGAYYHYGQLMAEMGAKEIAMECFDRGIDRARKLGDQHALGELLNARTNCNLEL